MKKFRKVYWGVIICMVILNIALYLLNRIGGISLINESLSNMLKLMIPILIIFLPYRGKGWECKFMLILCRLLAFLSMPCIMISLALSSGGGTDIKYAYIQSPGYTHKIIIEGSVSGLHHFSQHIKVYEQVGGIFKKDLHISFSVDEEEDGTFKKATYKDGIVIGGQTKYELGNGYAFEWIDENTLEISYINTDNPKLKPIKKKISLLY